MAERAVPVLASGDLERTLRSYERLGFANRGAPPSEWDYLILGRDGIELHFVGPSGGARPPGSCYLFVDDADAVYAEWQARAAPPARVEPPLDTAYGMREFTLLDADRNEVRVGSSAAS